MAMQGVRPGVWLTGLVGAALVAAAASGCDADTVAPPPPLPSAYVGVCVDPITQQRIPDWKCGGAVDGTGLAMDLDGFYWDYFPPTYVGVVPGYYTRLPLGVTYVRTLPRSTVIVVDRGVSSAGGRAATIRTTAVKTGAGRTVVAPKAPAAAKPNTGIQRGGFGGTGGGAKAATGGGTSGGS
jgi:hypothetical protein